MDRNSLSRVVSGSVMHRRIHPRENRFVYPVFFLLINIDELGSLDSALLGINRWRPLSFHFADHGDGEHPQRWIERELRKHNLTDCNGPIWVQTFPRVFGYAFNPVSFWYCLREDSSVGAIIAEVNNTFGERHCYVLEPNPKTGEFNEISAEKRMYVSPFYPVTGEYHFRFNTDFDAPRVGIDYLNGGQLQLNTAIWGKAKPLTAATLLAALIHQPFLTLGVVLRIHWQALRLLAKRTPFYPKPDSKIEEVSR